MKAISCLPNVYVLISNYSRDTSNDCTKGMKKLPHLINVLELYHL